MAPKQPKKSRKEREREQLLAIMERFAPDVTISRSDASSSALESPWNRRFSVVDIDAGLQLAYKDKVPVASYKPDNKMCGKRVIAFSFDHEGNLTRHLLPANIKNVDIESFYPPAPKVPKYEDIDLFTDFDDWDGDKLERYVFETLAARGVTKDWNWRSYIVMKNKPHRRPMHEARQKRLQTDSYRIPTFQDSSLNSEQKIDRRLSFFYRVTEVLDRYSLANKVVGQYVGEKSTDTCDERYLQAVYFSTSKLVDALGSILDEEVFNWPQAEILNVKSETEWIKRGRKSTMSDALHPNVDLKPANNP